MNKEYKEALKLIDKIYKNLYLQKEVIHGKNQYMKYENIDNYINRLERIHKKILTNPKYLKKVKELYYDKYVIKKENIPNEYYKKQQKMYIDRGYGYVDIDDKFKDENSKLIINDQKRSLDNWLDYYLSNDSSYIPTWAKFWSFQGMLKLGSYNKEIKKYNKRTERTIEKFPEINREAIALTIDYVKKHLLKEEIDDNVLKALIGTGSFPKIYEYIINKLNKEAKDNIKRDEGKWIKYNRGGDYKKLANSLIGYNTNWCTAGLETAKNQLEGGDLYIYYTLDSNNEYKVPRIAIRMENSNIAEIRGVADNQNIESNMEQVVEEKIKEFPDNKKYKKKVKDMEILTYMYEKNKNGGKLTKEDLRFLYEMDDEIQGFGYQKDPRIEEILSNRNWKKDISYVLNCNEEEVTDNPQDIYDGKKIVFCKCEILDFSNIKDVKNINMPKYYQGTLWLDGLTSAEGLVLPENYQGNITLRNLLSAEGLVLPKNYQGGLELLGLTSAKGLVLPENYQGNLYLNGLTSSKDLVLPKNYQGDLNLSGLTSAKGLVLPENCQGILRLNSLTNAEGLVIPENCQGDLYLNSLTNAEGLMLPKNYQGNLDLENLTSAKGLVLPENYQGNLNLSGLTSTEGLVLPENYQGTLRFDSLTNAECLMLPKNYQGNLDLENLTSVKGLVLPENYQGNLNLSGLTSTEGLVLPENYQGTLRLDSLTSVEGLVLPENYQGDLFLNGLTSAKGLMLPKNYHGKLYLFGLTYGQVVYIPDCIDCKVCTKFIGVDGVQVVKVKAEDYYSGNYLKEEEQNSSKIVK